MFFLTTPRIFLWLFYTTHVFWALKSKHLPQVPLIRLKWIVCEIISPQRQKVQKSYIKPVHTYSWTYIHILYTYMLSPQDEYREHDILEVSTEREVSLFSFYLQENSDMKRLSCEALWPFAHQTMGWGVEGKRPGKRRNWRTSSKREKPSIQPSSLSPARRDALREGGGWRCPRCWKARRVHSPATSTAPRRPRSAAGCMALLTRLCQKRTATGLVWDAAGRGVEDARGKQLCFPVPAVWRGWRRPRSFKGQAGAAGPGEAGTQEAAPRAQPWRHEAARGVAAQVGGNLRRPSSLGALGPELGWGVRRTEE